MHFISSFFFLFLTVNVNNTMCRFSKEIRSVRNCKTYIYFENHLHIWFRVMSNYWFFSWAFLQTFANAVVNCLFKKEFNEQKLLKASSEDFLFDSRVEMQGIKAPLPGIDLNQYRLLSLLYYPLFSPIFYIFFDFICLSSMCKIFFK